MGNLFGADFQDFIFCLNKNHVEYILVGGYSVVLHGYPRTTGDMDIWVNKTEENYFRLTESFVEFKMPVFDMTLTNFLGNYLDVFRFGVPPSRIDIMTNVLGLSFDETYARSSMYTVDNFEVRLIHFNDLVITKKASGRPRDLNDLENLLE